MVASGNTHGPLAAWLSQSGWSAEDGLMVMTLVSHAHPGMHGPVALHW